MYRHVVPLPALLVEREPPPAPLQEVVLLRHPQDRAHPREAVEHDGEERPVAEPDQRARIGVLEELPRLGRERTGGGPLVTTCFGPRTGDAGSPGGLG